MTKSVQLLAVFIAVLLLIDATTVKYKTHQNKKSSANVVRTIMARNSIDCARKCRDMDGCRSVNFKDKTCDLLSESSDEGCLTDADEWDYIGK